MFIYSRTKYLFYKRIKYVLRIYMKETVYTIERSAADQSRLFWLSLKGWFVDTYI
jgi:hypothetical protein